MEPTSTSLLLKLPRKGAHGFTLVELMVVMAIMTVILAVVIVNQNSFNRSFILKDTAYTVATTIRQAQSYGLSSRAFNGYRNNGYGIYINGTVPLKTYQLFADVVPGPGSVINTAAICAGHSITDPTNPEARAGDCLENNQFFEKVTLYTFSQGYTISKYCGYVGAIATCTGGGTPLLELNIVFQRPNLQTTIIGRVGASYYAYDHACIQIKAPTTGTLKYVKVTQFGQIIVADTCS